MSSVDYVAARKAENRADCRYCGMSDDECTTRLLSRKNACCGSCYQTDTHLPSPQPKRESLHEVIFWQIRCAGMDERALADWIVRFCAERIAGMRGDPRRNMSGTWGTGWNAAINEVVRQFAIPEGRSTDEQQ